MRDAGKFLGSFIDPLNIVDKPQLLWGSLHRSLGVCTFCWLSRLFGCLYSHSGRLSDSYFDFWIIYGEFSEIGHNFNFLFSIVKTFSWGFFCSRTFSRHRVQYISILGHAGDLHSKSFTTVWKFIDPRQRPQYSQWWTLKFRFLCTFWDMLFISLFLFLQFSSTNHLGLLGIFRIFFATFIPTPFFFFFILRHSFYFLWTKSRMRTSYPTVLLHPESS